MTFLLKRSRRLRGNDILREMLAETFLRAEDFIYPMFIVPGKNIKNPIKSMPLQYQFSKDKACEHILSLYDKGLKSVILFGLPEYKDEIGSSGSQKNGVVQEAVKEIKKCCPNILLITDVCLCEYTSHGHCGLIKDNKIDNDSTLEHLAKQALSHAESGVDMVAPSDMMDGRVLAIRNILDENGFYDLPIMSYSVKYSSSFYGPFREAADSTPQFGDRRSYQMDFRNSKEALNKIISDESEGADILMVKPAGAYLDIISEVRRVTNLPLAAYQVSGEYSMIKSASLSGYINEEAVILESLIAIKRAGANLILTYFTPQILDFLEKK